jgi:hypothetical protein
LKCLAERIADQRILRLIARFLKAGLMEDGLFQHTELGVPQGSICTPPTMLQTLGMMIRWSGWGSWSDAKNHVHVLLIHFDTLHQRANKFATRQPIRFRKPFFHFGSKGF